MRNEKLTMLDIENRIHDAYSMAKYTGESPAHKIGELKRELDSRTAAGRRRYPLYVAHWASGYDAACFKRMLTVDLECIRVNRETGETFTTDKSGRSTLPRIPDGRHGEVATDPAWSSGMRFIETGRPYRTARETTDGEG